jgi:hypothetical protein
VSDNGKPRTRADQLAVLTREIDVRVVNISLSGCLLEISKPLEVGTLATIRVTVCGEAYVDDVHVVRCQPVPGRGSAYQVGAQFLWTTHPTPQSLRRIAGSDVIDAEGWLNAKPTAH